MLNIMLVLMMWLLLLLMRLQLVRRCRRLQCQGIGGAHLYLACYVHA